MKSSVGSLVPGGILAGDFLGKRCLERRFLTGKAKAREAAAWLSGAMAWLGFAFTSGDFSMVFLWFLAILFGAFWGFCCYFASGKPSILSCSGRAF